MKRESDPLDDLILRAAQSIKPSEESCLAAERLVEFYSDRLNEPEAEAARSHLAACPICLAAAPDARQFVASMRELREQGATRERTVRRVWWLAAAAVAAIAVGLFAYRIAGPASEDPAGRWSDLVIAKAPYTPGDPADGLLWRGGTTRTGDPDGFVRGMKAYSSGDLEEAARLLAETVVVLPGHAEAGFYLGVALLLLERNEEALAHLERAANARTSSPRDDAQWYLALAKLKTGRQADAIESLQAIVAAPTGARHQEAEALLSRIRQVADDGRSAPRDP